MGKGERMTETERQREIRWFAGMALCAGATPGEAVDIAIELEVLLDARFYGERLGAADAKDQLDAAYGAIDEPQGGP